MQGFPSGSKPSKKLNLTHSKDKLMVRKYIMPGSLTNTPKKRQQKSLEHFSSTLMRDPGTKQPNMTQKIIGVPVSAELAHVIASLRKATIVQEPT